MTSTSDFDYNLPEELIAQEPAPVRDQSRMMVLHRDSGGLEHRRIVDLPGYLDQGDLLVVNDTKVISARLFGERVDTGGKVELLLVEQLAAVNGQRPAVSRLISETWTCLLKSGWRPREGIRVALGEGKIIGEIIEAGDGGSVSVRLEADKSVMEVLEEVGAPPVPPYIKRSEPPGDALITVDKQRYQTVYAEHPGAVAAPTAGLHFTPKLFEALQRKGVGRSSVTLHVGPGTFKPVKTDAVEDHAMDAERYDLPASTAEAVNLTKAAGGRIVAVGSTSTRTLETVVDNDGHVHASVGRSSLFIYPPYEFKIVNGLLTNFHLPKSTLIMMVCAFAGHERVMQAYQEAISEGYRFYSYGDCMLIL